MGRKTYRAAAIGHTGAGNYGHSIHLAYKGLENVDFVAVSDPDEEGRAKAVEETGAISSYSDYLQMLEKEELDIVSVCPRRPTEHLDMIMACIDAGCHVYSEKPMTATLADGDKIVNAAKGKGIKIAIAHQGAYLPRTKAIKKMLNEGKIGTLRAMYAHGTQDGRGGGEDMIVLGTHLFNLMRLFAGNPLWAQAHITVEGREMTLSDAREGMKEPIGPVAGDCVNSYFAFENAVSGFFDSRVSEPGRGPRMGMEIVGSEGTISFRGGGADNPVLLPHSLLNPSDLSQKWESLGLDQTPLLNGNNIAIVDLIDAIENDRKPISSAEDAVAALEMILCAYESQLTGGRVNFPMEKREHPLASN